MERFKSFMQGRSFWLLLATISIVFLVVGMFTGASDLQQVQTTIVMWVAFATADILNALKPSPVA